PRAPAPESAPRSSAKELLAVLGAGFLVSLANPFGIHALLQPFGFLFGERNQRIYRTIPELERLDWSANLQNGYPILLAGWVLLFLWRAGRRGVGPGGLGALGGRGVLGRGGPGCLGFF